MSRRERCCNCSVAVRRVVGPVSGLWRVRSTRSTSEFRVCAASAGGALGAYCVSSRVSLSLPLTRPSSLAGSRIWEAFTGE